MDKLQQVIEKFRLNVLRVEDVPQSFSSTVYKITLSDHRTAYIKIPYSKAKLELEYTILNRFSSELPVPKVLGYWEGNEDITGALYLDAINGSPITNEVNTKLAYDIGVHHASMHAIVPNEQDLKSVVANDFSHWSESIKQQFYSFAEDVMGVIEPELYEQSVKYFDQHLQLLPAPEGPCFIHRDFRPGNILVHENQVVGIIDFESVRIGATEMDFTKIHRGIFMKYPGTMEAYQQGYESIRPLIDLQEVLPFYQFSDAFNSIGWCRRRGIEKNKYFFEKNLSYLKAFFATSQNTQ